MNLILLVLAYHQAKLDAKLFFNVKAPCRKQAFHAEFVFCFLIV